MTRDSDDASSRRLREDQVTVDLSLTHALADRRRLTFITAPRRDSRSDQTSPPPPLPPRFLSILPGVSFFRLAEPSRNRVETS